MSKNIRPFTPTQKIRPDDLSRCLESLEERSPNQSKPHNATLEAAKKIFGIVAQAFASRSSAAAAPDEKKASPNEGKKSGLGFKVRRANGIHKRKAKKGKKRVSGKVSKPNRRSSKKGPVRSRPNAKGSTPAKKGDKKSAGKEAEQQQQVSEDKAATASTSNMTNGNNLSCQ